MGALWTLATIVVVACVAAHLLRPLLLEVFGFVYTMPPNPSLVAGLIHIIENACKLLDQELYGKRGISKPPRRNKRVDADAFTGKMVFDGNVRFALLMQTVLSAREFIYHQSQFLCTDDHGDEHMKRFMNALGEAPGGRCTTLRLTIGTCTPKFGS